MQGLGVDIYGQVSYNLFYGGNKLDIVEKLKKINNDLGISQEDISRDLGVSLRTLSRWFAGSVSPSKMALNNIEAYLYRQERRLQSND